MQMQGELSQTENSLDVAIVGRGWLQVTMPDGTTAYTRAGALNKSETGEIVTVDGYSVQPGITIPSNAGEVTISQSGEVSAIIGTASTPTVLGQLQLANFVNDAGLQPLGSNLFTQTPASGEPVVGNPEDTRLRLPQAELPGILERRSGEGNHRADIGAARLRDEFQGHHHSRRNGVGRQQEPQIARNRGRT